MHICRTDENFDRWDELLALIKASFGYMDGIIDPPSSATRLTRLSLKEKASSEICTIALDRDRLTGCVFCRLEPFHSLYIGKLAVLPEAQGTGIGRRLMGAVEAMALDLGCQSLRLETRIELAANHATFGRWGFIRTAQKSHPGYDRTTFIEMVKKLRPQAPKASEPAEAP